MTPCYLLGLFQVLCVHIKFPTPHSNPQKRHNYHIHFADEHTETQVAKRDSGGATRLKHSTFYPLRPRVPLVISLTSLSSPPPRGMLSSCFHLQEVSVLRGQLGDRLSVELDTAPTVDLNGALEEMRSQYETMLANNHREAEEWFAGQVSPPHPACAAVAGWGSGLPPEGL